MKLLVYCLLVLAVTAVCPTVSKADDATNGPVRDSSSFHTIFVPAELEPWQKRRKAFAETIRGVQERKTTALLELDQVLTDYEKNPFQRTPIESMEILGVFYIPKDGVEPQFHLVVMYALLGWYDVLRFGSPSAQSELFTNERFFLKPFMLGGPRVISEALQLFKSKPERMKQQLASGIEYAEKWRDNTDYDHEWPASYGLARMMAAMNGKPLKSTEKMPKEQWDKAWQDAIKTVTWFYSEHCLQYLEALNSRNHK
jgi:hypothetical protein